MQAEDSWLAFFFFSKLFLPKLFPMVRYEPGTFHSASERLNHSAIPETVNFMKSGGFHDEIWQISSMKSGGFHG